MSAFSNNERKVNAPNHFFCLFAFFCCCCHLNFLFLYCFVSPDVRIWVMKKHSNLIRTVAKFIILSMNEHFCLPNVHCLWRLFMRSFSPFQSHFINAINNANATLSHIPNIFKMKIGCKQRCSNDFKLQFESDFLCWWSVVWLWTVVMNEWNERMTAHLTMWPSETDDFLFKVYSNAFFHTAIQSNHIVRYKALGIVVQG